MNQPTIEPPSPEPQGEARHSSPTAAPSCLFCKHGREYYSHLTGCVECYYPRERQPAVVDMTLLRMGKWVTPFAAARICNKYEPNHSRVSEPLD